MELDRLKANGFPAFYQSGKGGRANEAGCFDAQAQKTVSPKSKTHIIYMKTDDMLYAGGNGTGLSYYLKYAPDSTKEDPVVIAKGVDEDGNAFERTIHINKVNPHYATVVEMRALEACLGVDKNGGLTSLPPESGAMGLNDRKNFIQMFRQQIRDMNVLKERQLASYYQYGMQEYLNFFQSRQTAPAGCGRF